MKEYGCHYSPSLCQLLHLPTVFQFEEFENNQCSDLNCANCQFQFCFNLCDGGQVQVQSLEGFHYDVEMTGPFPLAENKFVCWI